MNIELLYKTALELTKKADVNTKEEVLETYKYFVKELAKDNDLFSSTFVDDIQ